MNAAGMFGALLATYDVCTGDAPGRHTVVISSACILALDTVVAIKNNMAKAVFDLLSFFIVSCLYD